MHSDPAPVVWPRVIGQRRVKAALLAARRSGRLAHAYLFYGEEGVGKDAMALELARVIRCERGEDEACDACPSCARMATLQHPDVRLIVPLPRGGQEKDDDDPMARLSEADVRVVREQFALKAADPYHRLQIPRANVIKINSIREIRRESSFATTDRKRRVFVISGADAMNDAAANTLLKTLEEPPGETMLILTTAHRDALLPTILSRCQNVRFDPLSEEEILRALVARGRATEEQAPLLARLAGGSFTRALELAGGDVAAHRADVVDFVRKAIGGKTLELIELVERMAETKDRDVHTRFLTLMLFWFRDAMVLRYGAPIVNVDQAAELKSFVARFPGADLVRALMDVEDAISLVDRYTYIKLVLAQLAVRLRAAILGAPAEGAGRPRGMTGTA
ncbi:MAG TPA: DNA polymerase III subunit delta' [Bacteroidota bacterium]|nr:DNA polymerase III subunit delta' [Bacteroidota bacterium]